MAIDVSAVRTLSANSVRLTYHVSGDPTGAPVVLLHGSGSQAATWERFSRRLLAAGYRTIALDLRGHATSDRASDYALSSIRDDVLHLIEALDLREVTVVGHSVGAYAALAAAAATPDRITRLVLEDLAAPPQRKGSTGIRDLLPALTAAAVVVTQPRHYDLRAVASIVRQLTRPDAQWWAQLGAVRVPTLILSGGPTSCIPPQRLADVAAAIPGARLATIPVGHRVHSLAPEQFATEVLDFLADSDSLEPLTR